MLVVPFPTKVVLRSVSRLCPLMTWPEICLLRLPMSKSLRLAGMLILYVLLGLYEPVSCYLRYRTITGGPYRVGGIRRSTKR